MNCGRNARKKSATFGFSTLMTSASRKIRHAVAGARRWRLPARVARRPHARGDEPDAGVEKIGGAAPLDDAECRSGGREEHRQPGCRGERVHDAACRDAERRRHAGAESAGGAARGDVRHVGTRRDVEQQPGRDEQSEIVDADHVGSGVRYQRAVGGSGCPGISSYGCTQRGSLRIRASQSRIAGYTLQSTPISSSKKR